MKLFVICVLLAIMAWFGTASPIDLERQLINRSRIFRRSPEKYGVGYAKGQKSGGRDYNPSPPPLRKGQYMCGNKVCKLLPGEVPVGCNGMCQYAVP